MRRRDATDYVVKQAFAAYRDTSSDSDKSQHPEDVSLMVIEDTDNVFDSLLAFMEK